MKTKAEELVEAILIIGARRGNDKLDTDAAHLLIKQHVVSLGKRVDEFADVSVKAEITRLSDLRDFFAEKAFALESQLSSKQLELDKAIESGLKALVEKDDQLSSAKDSIEEMKEALIMAKTYCSNINVIHTINNILTNYQKQK